MEASCERILSRVPAHLKNTKGHKTSLQVLNDVVHWLEGFDLEIKDRKLVEQMLGCAGDGSTEAKLYSVASLALRSMRGRRCAQTNVKKRMQSQEASIKKADS